MRGSGRTVDLGRIHESRPRQVDSHDRRLTLLALGAGAREAAHDKINPPPSGPGARTVGCDRDRERGTSNATCRRHGPYRAHIAGQVAASIKAPLAGVLSLLAL